VSEVFLVLRICDLGNTLKILPLPRHSLATVRNAQLWWWGKPLIRMNTLFCMLNYVLLAVVVLLGYCSCDP